MNIILYAVQSQDGKWFRRKGYGGYGETWTEDFKQARIYNKIGPARGVIGFFANNYKEFPAPNLVELTISEVKILDESQRISEQQRKKEISFLKKEADIRIKKIEEFEKQAQKIKNQLKSLNKS